jgi:ABC-type polysaccharide/polyol phosphate export permease
LWAITHGLFDTIIIMIVLTVFGAATSAWAVLAPLPLIAGATFMAGLSLGVTAHVHDIDAFNLYMALFFSTMYVTGAFFPIDVLPIWLQIPARILPQTESIELTRAFLTGRFLPRHIYEAIYLLISAVVACEWAMRSLRRRMVA